MRKERMKLLIKMKKFAEEYIEESFEYKIIIDILNKVNDKNYDDFLVFVDYYLDGNYQYQMFLNNKEVEKYCKIIEDKEKYIRNKYSECLDNWIEDGEFISIFYFDEIIDSFFYRFFKEEYDFIVSDYPGIFEDFLKEENIL